MKKRKHAAARKAKAKAKKAKPKAQKPKKQARKAKRPAFAAKKEKKEIRASTPALFEEIILNCANCGKKMRLIKVPEFDPAGTLCSSCSKGEIEPPQG